MFKGNGIGDIWRVNGNTLIKIYSIPPDRFIAFDLCKVFNFDKEFYLVNIVRSCRTFRKKRVKNLFVH